MRIQKNNGILVDGRFRIDPEFIEGPCFVSHGHSDHLPRSGDGHAFCSDETFKVMGVRRGGITRMETPGDLELVNAGHVVGSNMLLYKDLLYTGDFCTRDRFFLKGAKPVPVKTLIIESTFGHPSYRFPSLDDIQSKVKAWVKANPRTIWFGYPFGKAQTLTALANHLGIVPYAAGEVGTYNQLVPGLEYHNLTESVMHQDEFVIIASPSLKKAFPSNVMRALGISGGYFSGWALVRNTLGVDASFPLSDHCGFDELYDFVKKTNPDQVLLVHGDGDALSTRLKQDGFDAHPLVENSLLPFLQE